MNRNLLISLGIVGLCAVAEAKPLKVHFRPDDDWQAPRVYFWSAWPEGVSTNWPGEAMIRENSAENSEWYTFEIAADRCNLIFNDGAHQTGDLFLDHEAYFQDGHWYTERPEKTAIFVEVNPSATNGNDYVFENSVSLNFKSVSDAKIEVRLNEGEWQVADFITIGQDAKPGERLLVDVRATRDATQVQSRYSYLKQSPEHALHPFDSLRIYQVMIESYRDGDPNRGFGVGYGPSAHNGDLKGIFDSLDEIASLGVNAIWLTPVFDAQVTDARAATGYFAKDYFAVDPHFGTLDELRALVDAAHQRGLYVLFDGVFGHSGGEVVPSPSGKKQKIKETSDFSGAISDFDNPETRAFFAEVAAYWIDTLGIDGWRLDQAYQVPLSMWREIRESVEAACARRKARGEKFGTLGFLVGEVWRDRGEITRTCYGGQDLPKALPSCFEFQVRYQLVQALAVEESGRKGPVSALSLDAFDDYPPHSHPAMMLGNHDLLRFGDLIQRAGFGGSDTPQYWARYRAALSFVAAYSGPISIYYGDEIGLEVPDFIQKGDRGFFDDHASRSEMPSLKNISEAALSLRAYLTKLMNFRAAHPALWSGRSERLLADDTIFVARKSYETDKIIYALNSSTEQRVIEITAGKLTDAFSGQMFESKKGVVKFELPPLTGLFLLENSIK